MARTVTTTKRLQIDKANTAVTVMVAVASFVVIFSLFACRAFLNTRSYQNRVITEQQKALKQLNNNAKAVDELVVSYKEFAARPENIIEGVSTGTGDRDGDNAKITLDALPSKYDFPALVTSLEKLILQKNFKIISITGIDQEVEQQVDLSSNTPVPVEMPFKISVKGPYDPMQELIKIFDQSIRPIQPQVITFTAQAQDGGVLLDLEAKTYYLPEKNLSIKTEVLK